MYSASLHKHVTTYQLLCDSSYVYPYPAQSILHLLYELVSWWIILQLLLSVPERYLVSSWSLTW